MKVFITLFVVAAILFVVNNLFIDHRERLPNQVNKSFDRIVEAQQQDLVAWKRSELSDPLFRKRKICDEDVVNWSDDRYFYQPKDVDSISVYTTTQGIFLIQQIRDGNCTYVSNFPLSRDYKITNRYLKPGRNPILHWAVKGVDTRNGSYDYRGLFYYELNHQPNRLLNFMSIALCIISLLGSLVLLGKKSIWETLSLSVILVLLRVLSLKKGWLQEFVRFKLFDPLHYSSSFINPTLGDLLFNVVIVTLMLWLISLTLRKGAKVFALIVSSALPILIYLITWSILTNSQIDLDVGQSIAFSELRVISYFIIIILVVLYYRFINILVENPPKLWLGTIISVLIPVVILFFDPILALIGFGNLILWLLLMYVDKRRYDHGYNQLLRLLLVCLFYSGFLSVVVYKYAEREDREAKQKFANYLLINRDVLGEYYIEQVIKDIEVSGISEEEDLLQIFFGGSYFNKYVVSFHHDMPDLSLRGTEYENIFLVNQGGTFGYLCRIRLEEKDVFIELSQKRRVPNSVFPALLTDSKYDAQQEGYEYAVFYKNELLLHRSRFGQGELLEPNDLENPALFGLGLERNDKHYLGIKAIDGRILMIISKKYSWRERIINSSFFFLILLLSFGLIILARSLRNNQYHLNFSGKIQLYLGLAFLIPLLFVAVALLNSLNTSYREEIDRNYLKQALYISNQLSPDLEDDEELDRSLKEIGKILQTDLSFYDAAGLLAATSQSEIFDLDLQSNYINPIVFRELILKGNQAMIADESIGALDFKVCYATVMKNHDQIVGFIAMPFFNSKNHLKRQQLEVFGNIISIFSFIIILAILVGNLALDNLFKPLRLIADKIRMVTLSGKNEEINYHATDEIGSLVKDYNHMVLKLEESKSALAKSQKESAWKEIAKQVAHEIKNPLTPMQLKIQQLLRRQAPETKEFQTLTGLLKQVDTLSQIATSFSAFAEMPAPNNEVFALDELIKETVGMYRSEDVLLAINDLNPCNIDADKDIFRRILNNILLNAIQSVEDKKAIINISLTRRGDKALLSVKDNGKGIPDSIRDKVFGKYFSTKEEGSGIGLALAKKGIENAGGNIWFESKEGEGSTFFISVEMVKE